MKINITHGVYRTLRLAESFRRKTYESSAERFDVFSSGVLLAMLEEEEYRAAHWLAEYGIARELVVDATPFEKIAAREKFFARNGDETAIFLRNDVKIEPCLRFYLDADAVTVGRLEPALTTAFLNAVRRLHEILPRVLFSTEHLLLALAFEEGETGSFLRNHHLTPERLLEKIAQEEETETFSDELIPLEDKTSKNREEFYSSQKIPFTAESSTLSPFVVRAERNERQTVYRILDASANRAMEAIRVLEDYVRFGLDDEDLTAALKQMRHELAEALREIPQQTRLIFRSIATDVGAEIEGKNEYRRESLDEALQANMSRLQESLRSVEEYGKIAVPNIARTVERLRYRAYALHQTLFAVVNSAAPQDSRDLSERQKRIAAAKLYVLLDARESEEKFAELAAAVIDGGADAIQLRDKQISDRLLLSRAKKLRELTSVGKMQTLMIVNDRPDVATLSGADGVHVGQDELPIREVRRIVPPEMLVGVSTHSLEQAREAERSGADYIGVGPVFPSRTKPFAEFPGLDFLKQAASEIQLPAFAIGGITPDNFPFVLAAGIRRAAVQSVVADSRNPAEICRRFLELEQDQ
ncbi:MAG: thiamine phosphate synthase [Planctomycetaceae bacterium]|jgi:thiamine-phosphate pyrophosphorylase|nr:thiamine phosphate synthase [Planctomycetaceae bacterium]